MWVLKRGVGWERGKKAKLHIIDWFNGRLQCTEIIPLAAQLAQTWSMIAAMRLAVELHRGGLDNDNIT